jgi:hypothetical protein
MKHPPKTIDSLWQLAIKPAALDLWHVFRRNWQNDR